jgi:hypothetical protein
MWDKRFENKRGKGGWVESVPILSIYNAHGEPIKGRKRAGHVSASVTCAKFLHSENSIIASCGSSDNFIKYWVGKDVLTARIYDRAPNDL